MHKNTTWYDKKFSKNLNEDDASTQTDKVSEKNKTGSKANILDGSQSSKVDENCILTIFRYKNEIPQLEQFT